MIKKSFLIACLSVGFAVITTITILTHPNTEGESLFGAQIDANDLTLKTSNLPAQALDDQI